jgi:hypothetical protein
MIQTIFPVITLWQPWATWIMRGWKTIETRRHSNFACLDGKTILIHAGLGVDSQAVFNPYLTLEQIKENPEEIDNGRGHILGSAYAQYLGCLDPNDGANALIECETLRYGLLLDLVTKFDKPIPAIGQQGIWYWDMELMTKTQIINRKA